MSLPDTYTFVYGDTIQPEEVLAVRKSTGWAPGELEEGWLKILSSCIAAVGVRDGSGELVGMGFIVGNSRHAVLCDFNVRPEHQHKGIGKAILGERMRIVDEQGIPFLYTSLSPENPLVSMYESFGFKAGDVYFRNNM